MNRVCPSLYAIYLIAARFRSKENLCGKDADALRVGTPCFAPLSVALSSIAPRALRWSTE